MSIHSLYQIKAVTAWSNQFADINNMISHATYLTQKNKFSIIIKNKIRRRER